MGKEEPPSLLRSNEMLHTVVFLEEALEEVDDRFAGSKSTAVMRLSSDKIIDTKFIEGIITGFFQELMSLREMSMKWPYRIPVVKTQL